MSGIFQSADVSERGVRVAVITAPDYPRGHAILRFTDGVARDPDRWSRWLALLPPGEQRRKAGRALARNARST